MIYVSHRADKRFARAVRRHEGPRLALVIVLGLGAAFLGPRAHAHAVIVAARPAMNAVLSPGDLDIRLEFNSRIDAARSRLSLRSPDQRSAPVTLTSDPGANVLAARARATDPGAWTLQWQVLSRDGHITRGDVRFMVRAR